MDPLEFAANTARVGDGSFVLALAGDLDLHTAPALQEELAALVRRDARLVVVDLTAVEAIDSTAIGLLLGILRQQRERGAELLLVAADPRVLRPLRTLGLDRVFTIAPTLAEAVPQRQAV